MKLKNKDAGAFTAMVGYLRMLKENESIPKDDNDRLMDIEYWAKEYNTTKENMERLRDHAQHQLDWEIKTLAEIKQKSNNSTIPFELVKKVSKTPKKALGELLKNTLITRLL